jgi:hypothetical protein
MVFTLLNKSAARLALLVCLVVISGCGGPVETIERHAVFGTVQVDKNISVNGSIRFIPSEGNRGPAAATAIVGGRYEFTGANGPVAGSHRVEVGISAEVGVDEKSGNSYSVPSSNSPSAVGKNELLVPEIPQDASNKTPSVEPKIPERRRKWRTTFDVPNEPSVHKDFAFDSLAP